MRKVVVHKAGSWDRLEVEEHPDPTPGPGEVLIAAEAIGVNFADCIVRMGLYASAKEYVGWPITPGFEVAGTVEAVGDGVDRVAPGDRVLAVTLFGGYATKVVVPAEQAFPIPEGLSTEEAAGFPTVFMTAYYALHELAHPREGQEMLVHSAAGGVGSSLVQLGKAAGCRVVGVVGGSHKVETARSMGADAVVDKSTEDLWPAVERHAPEGFHVALDANGVATLKESWEHLRPTGKLVIYGFHTMMSRDRGRPNWLKLGWAWLRTPRFDPLQMTNDNKSVLAFNLSYLFDQMDILHEGMSYVVGLLEEGRLKAPPVTTHPFERVADAHKALESGQTVGKVVLVT